VETIDIINKVFKFKISEHSSIKNDILEAIDRMGKYSYVNKGQQISNTDWHLPENFRRPYLDITMPILERYYSKLELVPDNIWFQQYYKNDYHDWHRHGICSYSSVYFLELPNQNIKTEFENLEIEVEEGDFIIFPGICLHRSPMNITTDRKTSIVVNLNQPDY